MPSISLKKFAVVLLAVIALSRLDKIFAALSGIYDFFYESFEPFRNSPVEGRFLVALALLVLLYVTIFKLLQNRHKR